MLAARTIKASTNSAGQEIYDEMTISYFEGTYDADWNVVGFEFYKNLVGKTSAQSTYDICYIDYTNICGNSGGEDTPTYTVTWKNYDDSVLKTDTVEYGTAPTYTGETPIKESDNTYTYTFAGWDKEVVAVAGDATYKATYEATKNKYTITFVNYDGSMLYTTDVEYGSIPVYAGETPIKESENTYTYTFDKWDKEIVAVAGDVTYKATYEATKLVNVDGLVNNAFTTINGYGATDKFEATLDKNTITVTIIDPTMNSMDALIGTGIAPAAAEFLKSEGIKSVTLTSGDAELVVTKNSLDATEVYNFLIAVTKDNATAADLDGTIINVSIAMEDGYATANSDSFEVVVDVKTPAEITTTVGDTTVGEVHEFEVTTKANDYAGVMVIGTSSFSNPEAIKKLEYYEPSVDAWYELTTDFGPTTGFPLSDATSKFRVTWKTAGEYTFTMKVVDVNDNTKVYAEVEKTVTVSNNSALVSNESELLAALNNTEYSNIELTDNIVITSSVVIARDVTIDGKGYSISKEGTPTYVSGGDNYIFKVYGLELANVDIKNIKLTNVMAAIMVGDYANVTLDNVDLDGNVWGGIEVKDTSTTSLTVNVENLKYTEEAYGKPIAWVDNATVDNATISFVLEGSDWSITTASVKNQVHYYLDAANAVE